MNTAEKWEKMIGKIKSIANESFYPVYSEIVKVYEKYGIDEKLLEDIAFIHNNLFLFTENDFSFYLNKEKWAIDIALTNPEVNYPDFVCKTVKERLFQDYVMTPEKEHIFLNLLTRNMLTLKEINDNIVVVKKLVLSAIREKEETGKSGIPDNALLKIIVAQGECNVNESAALLFSSDKKAKELVKKLKNIPEYLANALASNTSLSEEFRNKMFDVGVDFSKIQNPTGYMKIKIYISIAQTIWENGVITPENTIRERAVYAGKINDEKEAIKRVWGETYRFFSNYFCHQQNVTPSIALDIYNRFAKQKSYHDNTFRIFLLRTDSQDVIKRACEDKDQIKQIIFKNPNIPVSCIEKRINEIMGTFKTYLLQYQDIRDELINFSEKVSFPDAIYQYITAGTKNFFSHIDDASDNNFNFIEHIACSPHTPISVLNQLAENISNMDNKKGVSETLGEILVNIVYQENNIHPSFHSHNHLVFFDPNDENAVCKEAIPPLIEKMNEYKSKTKDYAIKSYLEEKQMQLAVLLKDYDAIEKNQINRISITLAENKFSEVLKEEGRKLIWNEYTFLNGINAFTDKLYPLYERMESVKERETDRTFNAEIG